MQYGERRYLAASPSDGRARGQSLVEMALVVPVLLLLMFGVVEMGRLFFAYVTVQHAARRGAQVASTGRGEREGTRPDLIEAAAREATNHLVHGDEAIITVRSSRDNGSSWRAGPGGPCEMVEVRVDYPYQPAIPIIASLMPSQITLIGRDRKINEPWIPCDR